jgi:glutamate racemase
MNPGPIGIFDSGVGGLTVFRAVERALPDERLVYLGDTARVPYGTKSADTVVRYSLEATHFLTRQGVKMLIVACNTASSVAIEGVARAAGVPVLGVILPGARRAVERSRSGRIGIVGTRATVGSGAYERAVRDLSPAVQVISRPCPLFVPLAEEGWNDGEIARSVAERYLEPFRQAGIDTLVLGCTHYPLLREAIGSVMGPDVTLVDSAESVAGDVHDRLRGDPSLAGGKVADADGHRFFVTDVPEPFQVVAERFLGRRIRNLERARIEGE